MLARSLLVATLVCGPVLAPRAASACSCGGTTVRPLDGSSDVPLNAVVVVWGAPWEAEIRTADEHEAVTFNLEEVSDFQDESFRLLRPLQPLEASTSYEVVLNGREIVSTFTTGSAVDEEGPVTPSLQRLRASRYRSDPVCGHSCWHDGGFDRIVVEHGELPVEAAFTRISVTIGGELAWEALAPVLAPGEIVSVLSTEACSLFNAPALVEDATTCARMTIYDQSGNATGGNREICAATETCAIQDCFDEVAYDAECLPVNEDDPPPVDPPRDDGGCSAGGAGDSMLLAIALLFFLNCWRFRARGQRRSRPSRRSEQ
jgi:hypothetical protein